LDYFNSAREPLPIFIASVTANAVVRIANQAAAIKGAVGAAGIPEAPTVNAGIILAVTTV
jgi:hypothetical protein